MRVFRRVNDINEALMTLDAGQLIKHYFAFLLTLQEMLAIGLLRLFNVMILL